MVSTFFLGVTPGIEPSHRAYETQVRTTCITIGGKGGIRTHGTFWFNGVQDRRIRPLCHLSLLERMIGFEPTPSAWKAESSPRRTSAFGLGGRIRTCDLLNPNQAPYQTRPHQDWHRWKESNPLCRGFGDRRSTIELHRHKLFLKLHYLHGFQSLLVLCIKV